MLQITIENTYLNNIKIVNDFINSKIILYQMYMY